MNKSFSQIYKKFVVKTTIYYDHAQNIQNAIPHEENWRIAYLTESLISALWQLWCTFCRQTIFLSCSGTISRQNNVIAARHGDNSHRRLGYEAKCATRGQNLKPAKTIQYLRQEPTWGDQDKIIDIITILNPANSNSLLSAFGLPVAGPKHLQTVRNACAHKNVETMSQVHLLTMHYINSNLRTPSDLAWQISISNNSCGIYSWIEDLTIIANQATATN